ncbi:hypothetical protein MRB53_005904 [Persea americana]|uniref:Uncharacterized protein n=1 Tax=Persea americana TaxID=3435 RepID=A0ACC2MEF6_PERAE|nr:hypothetical protein MRB53_005904 [Persea americana]
MGQLAPPLSLVLNFKENKFNQELKYKRVTTQPLPISRLIQGRTQKDNMVGGAHKSHFASKASRQIHATSQKGVRSETGCSITKEEG